MTDNLRPGVILSRPGLPVDPLLQVGAGFLTEYQEVTIVASGSARMVVADPLRVCLILYPTTVTRAYVVGPRPLTVNDSIKLTVASRTDSYHCRDFPGLIQGDLWVSGAPGDVFGFQSYILQPWWG